MPVGKARLNICRFTAARTGYSCGLAVLLFLIGSKGLQNAVAEGDTRTISMHHIHTDEDITITYKRDGHYDDAALEKLNWFLRDWRRGEETKMDPHLIDLVWEVQREAGSKEPIRVVCGYRSPQTNAMLRHRSRGVARFSQHMLGHAMDFFIPGAPLEQLRVLGLRLQRGGVGFYPTSGSPFVHMDTGGIRMWPRMTREELARVFPDGRTVHIPTDGRPLSGYALALADIRKRGNAEPSANSLEAARDAGVDVSAVVASNVRHVNPFAKLLGLAKDDEDEDTDSSAATTAPAAPTPAATTRSHIKQTVVAALERGVAKIEKIEKKVTGRAGAEQSAAATTPPKLIHTAAWIAPSSQSNEAPSSGEATSRATALTPNQIITARGYWEGLPDGMTAAQPVAKAANPLSSVPRLRGTDVASADPDATGVIGSLSSANDDRVPPQLALAYAEQPQTAPAAAPAAAPMGGAAARAAAGMTIAVKRAFDQVSSTVMTTSAMSSLAIKVGASFDNPWVRAIILSPSVHRFLTTLALGAGHFRSLAELMVKPASSVMMTFAPEPNPGLTHDHFSGSAIVFVSTVSYPTHTASLR